MPRYDPDVTIRWRHLSDGDTALDKTCCLYAIIDARTQEILYLGKADRMTVERRLNCPAKDGMWEYLAEQGIDDCRVLVGELTLPPSRRFSGALLADVESLLIMVEQPCANVQSRSTRIDRPGLVVACRGAWPGKAEVYVDGELVTD